MPGGFGGAGGGNMGGMLKQIQKMQQDMVDAQEALANETVEVSVGGGALTIVITGHQRVRSITINPAMLDTADADWATDLQDLLITGVNQAIEQSQAMARTLMIQGAGSDVGKSLIVAGLARAAKRRGLRVLPFKPQNMSNNAAVTEDGGEIGRAQALQALAAGVVPHTDMNPVLLKPETDIGAQIIVQGKRVATARAREYAALKPSLMGAVLESFSRLKARAGFS